MTNLISYKLLIACPPTVIQSPGEQYSGGILDSTLPEAHFYCIPQAVVDAVAACSNASDEMFAYAAAHRALTTFRIACLTRLACDVIRYRSR